jgi:hypothetical protein
MTVREPNILIRLWHWLAGRSREETSREAELRVAVADRDILIASLKTELEAARDTITVRQLNIDQLMEVVARDRERVRAETAAATFHHARAIRGEG